MRQKNTVEIKIRVTPEHLEKIESYGLKNRSEIIRRMIDISPKELIYKNKSILDTNIYYKDWIIYIFKNGDGYDGFAMPKKYLHIYEPFDYVKNGYCDFIDEKLKNNGIEPIEEECYYHNVSQFDESYNWLVGIDVKDPFSILSYLKNQICGNK